MSAPTLQRGQTVVGNSGGTGGGTSGGVGGGLFSNPKPAGTTGGTSGGTTAGGMGSLFSGNAPAGGTTGGTGGSTAGTGSLFKNPVSGTTGGTATGTGTTGGSLFSGSKTTTTSGGTGIFGGSTGTSWSTGTTGLGTTASGELKPLTLQDLRSTMNMIAPQYFAMAGWNMDFDKYIKMIQLSSNNKYKDMKIAKGADEKLLAELKTVQDDIVKSKKFLNSAVTAKDEMVLYSQKLDETLAKACHVIKIFYSHVANTQILMAELEKEVIDTLEWMKEIEKFLDSLQRGRVQPAYFRHIMVPSPFLLRLLEKLHTKMEDLMTKLQELEVMATTISLNDKYDEHMLDPLFLTLEQLHIYFISVSNKVLQTNEVFQALKAAFIENRRANGQYDVENMFKAEPVVSEDKLEMIEVLKNALKLKQKR
jgi:hypothetical protein